jgi:hypothetical protein
MKTAEFQKALYMAISVQDQTLLDELHAIADKRMLDGDLSRQPEITTVQQYAFPEKSKCLIQKAHILLG